MSGFCLSPAVAYNMVKWIIFISLIHKSLLQIYKRYFLRENSVGRHYYYKPSIAGMIFIKTWKIERKNLNQINNLVQEMNTAVQNERSFSCLEAFKIILIYFINEESNTS